MGQNAQYARDRAEIEEAGYKLGRANDSRTPEGFARYSECMTDDVVVEYEFGTWKGLSEQIRIAGHVMTNAFSFTHHLLTNPIVEIDGDKAKVEWRVTAAHGMQVDGRQKVIWGGSTYKQELVRTPAGWRISRHTCPTSWIDDDGGLIAACMQGAMVALNKAA